MSVGPHLITGKSPFGPSKNENICIRPRPFPLFVSPFLLLCVIGKVGTNKKQQALLSFRSQFPSIGYKENSVNKYGYCLPFDAQSVQTFSLVTPF